jgi:hypothetical protein
MSDHAQWLAANDRYLAGALEALRARLTALADPNAAAPKPRHARHKKDDDGEPALTTLARRLGLSAFERDTLLLCAAMEFDTAMGGLCARAQADPARPYPTFALALALFDDPAWDALSPERPLRHWRLIEIIQPAGQPLIASALKADERIVNYIKGLNYLDDRLAPLVTPMAPAPDDLPPSQATLCDVIVRHLQSQTTQSPPLFQLLGADGPSKRAIARRAADQAGLMLYRLAADAAPTQTADVETFCRLWRRESALLPLALYIDAAQMDRTGDAHAPAVKRIVESGAEAVFLDCRDPWPDLVRDSFHLAAAKPTASEQHAAWLKVLGPAGSDAAARLAGQFNLDMASIAAIAVDATAAADDVALPGALWTGCVDRTRPALDRLAQPIVPKASWDDLELAAPEKTLLRQIAAQAGLRSAVYDDWGFRARMNRGLGIAALFAGESGCGKTMAAEVIANALNLALYRIDLSAVVNKYIGETEKNLCRLFDAAEAGGAILFFDEADALFGKRGEVNSSHDRYANIEVDYLLQRVEAYSGLAILATNKKSDVDSAFVRRMRFIVTFSFPALAERLAIWRKVFPPQVPVSGVDFARLAKLHLTGASIHSIALNAAFLAAAAGSAVTMPLLLDAARGELRKLEKVVNENDFRQLEAMGAKA